MVDALIVLHFENLIINVFGLHIGFIILQVSMIMEVPLPGSQIGPCLKCSLQSLLIDYKRSNITLRLQGLPMDYKSWT